MSGIRRGTSRNHIVTVNVEDYFQVGAFRKLIPFEHWERFETRIHRNTEATLELLADTGNQATFFASGWIGENYGTILRHIAEQGHEVACSGYYQQSVRDIPPLAFRQDLKRSREAIEDATGHAVHGFRIGRDRIGPEDLWVLDTLSDEGFHYDASLCPIGRQFAQDDERFRLHKHRTPSGDIWEVPASSLRKFGWAVPFSGGNYIRQLPAWAVREAVARWVERREAPLVMYFHVWELDSTQPTISAASRLQKIRHYRNIGKMPERVRYFLQKYPFTSIRNYLDITRVPIPAPARVRFPEPAQTPSNCHGDPPRIALTIVIPCYNEEASLDYLARTLASFAENSHAKLQVSFVLVDDGSTDGTWAKLEALFGKSETVKLVRHVENQGIAAAILTGAEFATTDFVAVIDADCTFDPMQLNAMIELMEDGVAAVSASPFHSKGSVANVPRWRMLLSRGAAFLYRCVLRHQFTSYTSCFRIYRREVLDGMSVYFDGFCGVAEILARLDQRGYALRECPAELQVRVLGHSKINLASTIVDHLHLISRLACARWLKLPLPQRNKR